jgi:hypothetical protein
VSKPRKVGAYANQRLNSTKLERLKEENQDSEPDLGKSGRPGLSGGLGKRGHGGNGNPPCNRKGKAGNPPPTTGAPELYPDQVQFILNISCLCPAYVRGEAYLAAGKGSAAVDEFQRILDHSGLVWNCWTGALARLGVARANALLARTSQGADADAARVRALAAYKDFFALWKDADPDIPILQQAKAEYAKLQ